MWRPILITNKNNNRICIEIITHTRILLRDRSHPHGIQGCFKSQLIMSAFDNPSDQGLTTSQRRFERPMTDHIVYNPGAVIGAVQPDTESRSLSLSLSLSLSQDIWVFWQPSARWWWQSVRISQLCNTNDGAAQPSSENGAKSPLLLPKAAYGVNLVAGSRAGGSSPNNCIISLTSSPCYLFNYFRTYFACKCSVGCLF
jgi:hypothetical protein